VLLSVDTLRADHLGCYGYPRDTSPEIDAELAGRGAVFEDVASTTSWTLPAHAALLTGLNDSVHGCTDTDRPLSPDRTTLAERFAASGYRTAGFFSGPYLHPAFGLGQGFQTYVDCTSYSAWNEEQTGEGRSIEGPELWRKANDDVTNPRVRERVGEWLDQAGDEPFFLFVHLWDVHFDFVPPAPYDTLFDPDYEGEFDGRNFFFDERVRPGMDRRDLEHLIALYDGEIAWTDHHVGELLDDLERLGIADDTIVALTADHGTGFFEHGQRAHRNGLFDELVRIPLVVRWPGEIREGTRIAGQVSLVDVAPTLLELAGLGVPEDVMGRSLASALWLGEDVEARVAVSELDTLGQSLSSFRTDEHKLIHDRRSNRALVYDLEADPGERKPLSRGPTFEQAGTDARRAGEWLEGWKRALPEGGTSGDVPAEVWERLRDLGYVGDEPGNGG